MLQSLTELVRKVGTKTFSSKLEVQTEKKPSASLEKEPEVRSTNELPVSLFNPDEDLFLPLQGWACTDLAPIQSITAVFSDREISLKLRPRNDVVAAFKKEFTSGYDDKISTKDVADVSSLKIRVDLANGVRHWISMSASPANATEQKTFLDRSDIGLKFLRGYGAELGALHNPVPLHPRKCQAVFVDKYDMEKLQQLYPEIPTETLVTNFVVDDGQTLKTFAEMSLGF